MFKYILKISFCLLVVLFCSCQKDDEGFRPLPNGGGVSYESNIVGIVVDKDQNGIEGAYVSYNGKGDYTDEHGVYQFIDVLVDSRHNFINITKEGYFEGTKTFRTSQSTTISLNTILLEKNFDQSFSSPSGGTITEDNIEINFAPNSIVYNDAMGDIYNGEVRVAIQYLDPTSRLLDQEMPGDLSGINDQNVLLTLTSYGMAYVELQSSTGEKLQLKEGNLAMMSAIVPDDILANAPETINLWYFDVDSGFWKESGNAILQGNKYQGEVSHFSCWNFDSSVPSIVINGRVIDQNGNPLAGVNVYVSSVSNSATGKGFTNYDGSFSGSVAKDELLEVSVHFFYECNDIYQNQIGPFDQDSDIGDIVIDMSSVENGVMVSASFVNCEGDPVENGVVKVLYRIFPMVNSEIDVVLPGCDFVSTYNSLIGYDLDSGYGTVEQEVLNIPGQNDMGTIEVCLDTFSFINIISEDLGIEETCSRHLAGVELNGYDRVWGSKGDTGPGIIRIEMSYNDGVPDFFALGSFPLEFTEIKMNGVVEYTLVSGEITTTHYYNGPLDPYLKGSYIALMKDNAGLEYDFHGTFKVKAIP